MTVFVFSEVAYKYSGSDSEENPAKEGKCSINSFEHGKPKFSQLVTVHAMSQIIHLNLTQIDSMFSESSFKSNTSMSSNEKRTLARTDSDKVHNLHFKWKDVLNFSGKRYCRIRTSELRKWEVGEKLVKFGWKWKLVKWIDDKFKRKRSPLCFYHLRPWLTLKRETENFWKESSFDHE